MRNQEKVIIIAIYDGWEYNPDRYNDYHLRGNALANNKDLVMMYLTDLNYLIPVALKVFYECNRHFKATNTLLCEYIQMAMFDVYLENQNYQTLFDNVFLAIDYLNKNK